MFGKTKVLLEEIAYLRELNKDLLNRVMALTNRDALYDLKQSQVEIELPKFVNPLGKIETIEANTKEEKLEKEFNKKFFYNMFGG